MKFCSEFLVLHLFISKNNDLCSDLVRWWFGWPNLLVRPNRTRTETRTVTVRSTTNRRSNIRPSIEGRILLHWPYVYFEKNLVATSSLRQRHPKSIKVPFSYVASEAKVLLTRQHEAWINPFPFPTLCLRHRR